MKREIEEMDRIADSYMSTLKALKPRLGKSWKRTDMPIDEVLPPDAAFEHFPKQSSKNLAEKSSKKKTNSKSYFHDDSESDEESVEKKAFRSEELLQAAAPTWKSAKDSSKSVVPVSTKNSYRSVNGPAATSTKTGREQEKEEEDDDDEGEDLSRFFRGSRSTTRSIASMPSLKSITVKDHSVQPEISKDTTSQISVERTRTNSFDNRMSSNTGFSSLGYGSTAGMSVDSLNTTKPQQSAREPQILAVEEEEEEAELPPRQSLMNQISTSRTWSSNQNGLLYVKENDNNRLPMNSNSLLPRTFPSSRNSVAITISGSSDARPKASSTNDNSILTENLEESYEQDESQISMVSNTVPKKAESKGDSDKERGPTSSNSQRNYASEEKQPVQESTRKDATYKVADDDDSERFNPNSTNNTFRSDGSETFAVNFDLSLDPRETKQSDWTSESGGSPSKYEYTAMRKNNPDDDMVLLGTGKLAGNVFETNRYMDTFRTQTTGTGSGAGTGTGVGTGTQMEQDSLADSGQLQHQLEESSAVFEGLKSGNFSASGAYSSGFEEEESIPKIDATHEKEQIYSLDSSLVWQEGKAPLDLLELAAAFEVYISSLRMSSIIARQVRFSSAFWLLLNSAQTGFSRS